jgi:hypothetical protein
LNLKAILTGAFAAGIALTGAFASTASASAHASTVPLRVTVFFGNHHDFGAGGAWGTYRTLPSAANPGTLKDKISILTVGSAPAADCGNTPGCTEFTVTSDISGSSLVTDVGALAPNQAGPNAGRTITHRATVVLGNGSVLVQQVFATTAPSRDLDFTLFTGDSLRLSGVAPLLWNSPSFAGVSSYSLHYNPVPASGLAEHWDESSTNNDGQTNSIFNNIF